MCSSAHSQAGLDRQLAGHEETFVDLSTTDYDDSLVDMMDVLQRIRKAFFDNKGHAPLAKDLCNEIVQKAKALNDTGEQTYGDDAQEAFACIDKALAMLSKV